MIAIDLAFNGEAAFKSFNSVTTCVGGNEVHAFCLAGEAVGTAFGTTEAPIAGNFLNFDLGAGLSDMWTSLVVVEHV